MVLTFFFFGVDMSGQNIIIQAEMISTQFDLQFPLYLKINIINFTSNIMIRKQRKLRIKLHK